MSSPAPSSPLNHVGPWTEPDYFTLPEDRRRIELLDGGLLVSPAAGGRRQQLSSHLCHALGRAAPNWLEVLRVELAHPGPGSTAYQLQRGHYVEVAASRPGQLLRLTQPFPVDLDLAQLADATRPSG